MSNRLSFTDVTETQVKLDGKVVGLIKQVKPVRDTSKHPTTWTKEGYQYFPKGSKTGGEVFATKGECMYSLYDMGND